MFKSGVLWFAVILTMVATVAAPARSAELSVQIVNPDEHALVRVFLDRALIYEGVPKPVVPGGPTMLPITAGTYDAAPSVRHQLITEVPSTNISARFEWEANTITSRWIVIHYYPGRPGEAPSIIYRLQNTPFKLK